VVIAGHARLMAAIELDLKTVPVIRVTHLTDAQVKAFRIADNRLVELAEWDNAVLAVELEAIIEGGVDLDLTGLSVPEVDLVFSDVENDEAEEAEVELPTGEPVSRAGDVWIVDGHRILCGNALDVEAYGELMETERAAMVFSDPPYNVPIEGHVSGKGRHRHREFIMASGEMTEPDFFKFLERSIQNAIRFSRFDASVWRRIATRFDRNMQNFMVAISLAAAVIWWL
jgi:hypothetical protein